MFITRDPNLWVAIVIGTYPSGRTKDSGYRTAPCRHCVALKHCMLGERRLDNLCVACTYDTISVIDMIMTGQAIFCIFVYYLYKQSSVHIAQKCNKGDPLKQARCLGKHIHWLCDSCYNVCCYFPKGTICIVKK